ncbi:MAG: sensor histidine kinase [Longimicrobiales bacterium]
MNPSTRRVRLQLTAWYIGVFAVILALFGIAVYTVANRQQLLGLNNALERTVYQRTRLVLAGRSVPIDFAQDTALYGRAVFVFNDKAEPYSPKQAQPWVRQFAQIVLRDSIAQDTVTANNQAWLLYGKKFRTTLGNTYATVAFEKLIDIRDRFPSFITAFAASAVLALFLIGIGGFVLAGKSTAPIERAFQQMRRFMGDAAHELKTPVAVLRARSDVGLQRPRNETEYQEILTGISAEAKRLGSLVENMLLLARADAGEWPLYRENVFLDDVLLDAASAARALGATKGVNVEVGVLEETPVQGDPNLLRQLFLILLDNAVNFTAEGGHVTASAQRNGTHCKVIVSDTGTGIPATALPHIFDRFYRADPARSRAGAGLGLSIARWIVDAHKAVITVDSKEGHGTKVEVVFSAA